MKHVLITGKNSYIGSNFIRWLSNAEGKYKIEAICVKDDLWKNENFSKYDVVLHVAGIAHVSANSKLKELYYRVNRDLTIEIAEKASRDGVKQFIFMSSMIIFGDGSYKQNLITENTKPNPTNFYGDSKLLAEDGLRKLQRDNFSIVILRPPMIYGKDSKGNYSKLSKLAKKVSFFPDINNKRSMLHIDNLSEFIRLMIENDESGTFYPQNKEYVKTSELVRLIGQLNGNTVRLTKVFNFIILLFINKIQIFKKVFGDFAYDQSLSDYSQDYRVHNFKESIKVTEKYNKFVEK